MKYHIGYTAGVFDMFHIGHLNLIKQAKARCDILVVGVNSDELVKSYKDKLPVINQEERLEIISALRYVDKAVLVSTLDKTEICKEYNVDAVFIGDDWKGSERWNETERELKQYNTDVVYLSRTEGISSTMLRDRFLEGK